LDRYQTAIKRGAEAGTGHRRLSMRTISFTLAFAFVLAGPSLAGSVDNRPGIGTFSYSGSPIVPSMPRAIVVAATE
jgi:hypothetical protein